MAIAIASSSGFSAAAMRSEIHSGTMSPARRSLMNLMTRGLLKSRMPAMSLAPVGLSVSAARANLSMSVTACVWKNTAPASIFW